MRTHGTLIKWNDERGFGFISSAGGREEIFVHISAFPRDGKRPQLNELVSFETQVNADGRRRAVQIMRPGQRVATPGRHRNSPKGPGKRFATGVIAAALIASLGLYAYDHYRTTPHFPDAQPMKSLPASSSASGFRCDGRTMCSEMNSCQEATFFIRNCPNTAMDGDNDGVPCESQWCN